MFFGEAIVGKLLVEKRPPLPTNIVEILFCLTLPQCNDNFLNIKMKKLVF